jgi:outer membrane protein TolC
VSLPFWNRAQGEQAAAAAREISAHDVRDATARAADRQLEDALAAYISAKQAAETFAREVIPLLDDSEGLLQRRIDAGQIAISEYLVARQELLSARREYLERQLAVAKAAAMVCFVAGLTP